MIPCFLFFHPSPLFQGIAMACGFLVVIALSVAAFFAQKTRGKIWRHGKPNIQWVEPLVGGKASEGRDVEEWVRAGGRRPRTPSRGQVYVGFAKKNHIPA